MNPHLSKDTTTPDTASIIKHAGWEAARAGKRAWIIDTGDPEELWFEYTHKNIEHLRRVRKQVCEALRKGKAIWS